MQTAKKIILAIILVNLLSVVPFLLINSIGHRALTVSLHLHNRTDHPIEVGVSYDFKYKDIPAIIRLKPRERRDFTQVQVIRGPHDLMEFSVGNEKLQVYLYEDDRKRGEYGRYLEKAVYVDISPNAITARVTNVKHAD
jgi:hypothetical protein